MEHVIDLAAEYTRIRYLIEELKKKQRDSDDVDRKINSLYGELAEIGALLAQKIHYKVNF